MKGFFFLKVWAKNMGVHYTGEHIIHSKTWCVCMCVCVCEMNDRNDTRDGREELGLFD